MRKATRRVSGTAAPTGSIRWQCLQGLKDLLIDNGMQVFESTEMERLEDHTAYTHAGSVTADNIIVAVDKLTDSISPLADETFHAQTFLSVTEPLTDKELRILFPSGEQMQCWDSKLVYSYFRLTADNRLLLGGGTPVTTFLKDAYNNPGIIRRIIKDFRSHFPELNDLSFIQFWPGQIDMTRDLLPVIARPPEHRARALHSRLRGHSVGDVLRQLYRKKRSGRGGRRLQEVFQLLLEPAIVRPAEQPRQGHRQAHPVLARQQLGEVLSGRHTAQSRRDTEGVLISRSSMRSGCRRRLLRVSAAQCAENRYFRTRRQQQFLREHGIGLDDRGDASGPAGLVGGADTGAGVAVKVFVEEHQVAPVRIVPELLRRAVDRALAGRIAQEDPASVARRVPARPRAGVIIFPEPVGHSTLKSSP